jgi:uncharacterized lipoprotein YmbA
MTRLALDAIQEAQKLSQQLPETITIETSSTESSTVVAPVTQATEQQMREIGEPLKDDDTPQSAQSTNVGPNDQGQQDHNQSASDIKPPATRSAPE